jgi:ketosteroid isomerase-like protein
VQAPPAGAGSDRTGQSGSTQPAGTRDDPAGPRPGAPESPGSGTIAYNVRPRRIRPLARRIALVLVPCLVLAAAIVGVMDGARFGSWLAGASGPPPAPTLDLAPLRRTYAEGRRPAALAELRILRRDHPGARNVAAVADEWLRDAQAELAVARSSLAGLQQVTVEKRDEARRHESSGETFLQSGRTLDGIEQFWLATTLYREAARDSRPAPPAGPRPASPARAEILSTLEQYSAAYNRLDAEGVGALMIEDALADLTRAFARYQAFRLVIDPLDVKVAGGTATVVCRQSRSITTHDGETSQYSDESVVYELRRTGNGWRIVRAIY